MAGTGRGRYSPEYRERLVELVRAGRSPASLAREFEPTEQTIRNWVRQADLDEVFGFIEGFYNTRRLHSALGYRSPADFEKLHHAA